VLNEFAGRVLELIDGNRTLGEVVEQLCSEFRADDGMIKSDVMRFATELEASGLVELETEAGR